MLPKPEKGLSFVEFAFQHMEEQWKKSDLKKIREIVNWDPFEKRLRKLYAQDVGRPAWAPIILFRCLMLAEWYGLSDPALEQALTFRLDFKRFAGLRLEEKSPDETTFVVYRKRIQPLWDYFLDLMNRQIENRGFELHKAISVDATLVEAHSKPKKQPGKDDSEGGDPDGSWRGFPVKKLKDDEGKDVIARKTALYGYKINMATSVKGGFVSGVSVCPANEHEIHHLKEFIRRAKTRAVYADKGYTSLRKYLKDRGIRDGIQAKAVRGHPLIKQDIERNKRITKKRRIVEANFGSWKRHYGWFKTRFMGLLRNQVGVILTALAWNMKKLAVMTG